MCFLCVNRKVGGLGILQECQLHCDKNFDWKSYDFPYYHQGIMNITWNIPINGNSKILLFRSELFKSVYYTYFLHPYYFRNSYSKMFVSILILCIVSFTYLSFDQISQLHKSILLIFFFKTFFRWR